jgi:flagellar hook-basal body complex protein FliE
MANEIAGMITADLAALTNAASDLAQQAGSIAPAAQFGADFGAGANAAGQSGGSFADAMMNAFSGVNAADQAAGQKMADVDAGRSDDLVGAMLASQEASLSFSMLMQVRNKVMGAVDELIKLPL